MSRFDTLAVHAGRKPDGDTGALLTPIHQSTTYAQEDIGVHKGHTYSRASNPTVAALEERLNALEGGVAAVAFSSGMAAIDAVLRRLRSGDHVVLGDVVYGGTVRLLREVYAHHGVEFTFADASDPAAVERAIRSTTKLVLIESPSNPTLKLADIRGVAAVTRRRGIPLALDNTFLTPYAQRAFDLGADLAIHSTTKYLEGHNATIGGAVIVAEGAAAPTRRGRGPQDASSARESAEWIDWLTLVRKSAGTNQSPFEAWLTLRGTKTLGVRLDRHAASALAVAEWLEAQLGEGRVRYPFLPSHPQHALALAQQRNGGGLVSFEVGSAAAARRFAKALKVVTLAENLGAAESLLTHPATMTHAAYTSAERERLGVSDGLLRLSVGLEDVDDIIEDLARGLVAAREVVALV